MVIFGKDEVRLLFGQGFGAWGRYAYSVFTATGLVS